MSAHSHLTPTSQTELTNPDTRVRILSVSDPFWMEIINRVDHDVYHLAPYVAFEAAQMNGEPIAIYAEYRDVWVFTPLIIRAIPSAFIGMAGQLLDATSPYGYPSPLTNVLPNAGQDRIARLLQALKLGLQALRDKGVITLFVRLHPLLAFPLDALQEIGTFVYHGHTVFADLMMSDDDLWREMRADHRRDVTVAVRKGATAYVDEDWSRLPEFVEVYQQTMHRVHATGNYHFSERHFMELKSSIEEYAYLSIVEVDGHVGAAGIMTEKNGIVQCFLSGTSDKFLKLSPNKVRLDFVRSWSQSRGNRYFHLGGGVGGKMDTLFDFKASFFSGRSEFYTWRVVIDDIAYIDIAKNWRSVHGDKRGSSGDFSPAYRRSFA